MNLIWRKLGFSVKRWLLWPMIEHYMKKRVDISQGSTYSPIHLMKLVIKFQSQQFREYLDMLLQNERNLRPQTPRLKYPEISMTKNVLDNLQTKSRGTYHSHQTILQNYQIVRKRYKKIIRSTKSSFWRKVLCSQNP